MLRAQLTAALLSRTPAWRRQSSKTPETHPCWIAGPQRRRGRQGCMSQSRKVCRTSIPYRLGA